MANSISLDTLAEFTWDFGSSFLLEIEGNRYYVWSDPDYNGDNTIQPYYDNPADFTAPGFSGRAKGKHLIREYCGPDVKFIDCA